MWKELFSDSAFWTILGVSSVILKFRSLMQTHVNWLTELANDSQASKYSLSIYPRAEQEVEESLKKELEDSSSFRNGECIVS